MTTPWQLFVTWGLMVGIGSGAGATGMAAAIANRWFAKRNGLAMGLLTAANAVGQLVFLPLLAMAHFRDAAIGAIRDQMSIDQAIGDRPQTAKLRLNSRKSDECEARRSAAVATANGLA
jgi:hypothetical protein